jgi:hypothetical protein
MTVRYVGACHHGMARPQVANGGTDCNFEGSVNVLNKHSGTAANECSSRFGVGGGANNSA